MENAIQNVPGADIQEQEIKNENSIFDFEEQSWKTDFVIIVEGKRLHVARNILSLASPVFDRMLQSDFKECETGELEMPAQKLEDVKLFLQCIYPNTLTPMTCETALRILPLIEKYQVLQLKATCENAILSSINDDTPIDALCHILREACLYGLKDARKKCVRLACRKPTDETDVSSRKYTLPDEVINEILRLKITDLEIRNKEMKCTNSELQKRTTSLEEREKAATSDLKTLHDYISNDLQQAEDLRLDPELKWKEAEVLIKFDPSNDCRSSRYLTVGDVKLSISTNGGTSSYSEYDDYDGGYSDSYRSPWDVKENRFGSECFNVAIEKVWHIPMVKNIHARFILINSKSKSENLFRRIHGWSTATKNKMKIHFKKTSFITDKQNGFVKNGHIWLLVQLFVSEPINYRNKTKSHHICLHDFVRDSIMFGFYITIHL